MGSVYVSLTHLRSQAGKINALIAAGNEVYVTVRGLPEWRLLPLQQKAVKLNASTSLENLKPSRESVVPMVKPVQAPADIDDDPDALDAAVAEMMRKSVAKQQQSGHHTSTVDQSNEEEELDNDPN